MCGFVGFSNFTKNISNYRDITKIMNNEIGKRGPDEEGYYEEKYISLGHKRLAVIDPTHGKQPMTVNMHDNTYTICYNGQIYNTKELKNELKDNGFSFEGHCDTEVLLKAYIHYGHDVVKHLNGIFAFAIWDSNKEELFLARDHFGVKPLYYSLFNHNLIFASEIKAILKFPNFETQIDSKGISELFGIGPAHTPGTCVFKDIYELKPAHLAIYNKSRTGY